MRSTCSPTDDPADSAVCAIQIDDLDSGSSSNSGNSGDPSSLKLDDRDSDDRDSGAIDSVVAVKAVATVPASIAASAGVGYVDFPHTTIGKKPILLTNKTTAPETELINAFILRFVSVPIERSEKRHGSKFVGWFAPARG